MTIHVLAYLPRLPRLLYAEARDRPAPRAVRLLGGRAASGCP